MGASGALLLIGDLHFAEQQWQDLKNIDGVAQLKVRLISLFQK